MELNFMGKWVNSRRFWLIGLIHSKSLLIWLEKPSIILFSDQFCEWFDFFFTKIELYIFVKKCINSRKNRIFSSSWKVPFCGGFASLYLVAIGVIDIKRCLPVSIFQSNSHFFGMYNVRVCMQGLDFIVFSRNTFFFQENIQLCRVVICRAFFWHVGVNACKALSANRMFGGFFPKTQLSFFCKPIKGKLNSFGFDCDANDFDLLKWHFVFYMITTATKIAFIYKHYSEY